MSATTRPGGADDAASRTIGPTGVHGQEAGTSDGVATSAGREPRRLVPATGSAAFSVDTAPSGVAGTGDHRRPWHRRINWSAALWVVFLLIPLTFLVTLEMNPWSRTAGLVGTLGFMGYYTYAVSTRGGWEALPEGASPWRQLLLASRHLAVLAALAALMAVGLSWWAFNTLPFFSAFILFSTRITTGLVSITALNLTAVATTLAATHDITFRWVIAGCAMSSLSISAARIGEEVRARRATAEKERAAALEREEIGRDVHDLLGHSLTVLTLKAEVARRLVARDPAATQRELDEIIALSRTALADVRGTVTRLRTPDLASQVETSRTAFAAAEVEMTLVGRADSVPERQRTLLAWALREATTNVLRHAGATQVRIDLRTGMLRVLDDGAGLGHSRPGNGMTGLRSRIEAEGGSFTVLSPAWVDSTHGTLLEVRLP